MNKLFLLGNFTAHPTKTLHTEINLGEYGLIP